MNVHWRRMATWLQIYARPDEDDVYPRIQYWRRKYEENREKCFVPPREQPSIQMSLQRLVELTSMQGRPSIRNHIQIILSVDDNIVIPIFNEMMTIAVTSNHKITISLNDVSMNITMIVILITTTIVTHHFMIDEYRTNVIMITQYHPVMMQHNPEHQQIRIQTRVQLLVSHNDILTIHQTIQTTLESMQLRITPIMKSATQNWIFETRT